MQDRSYLNPSPRLIVLRDFPSFFLSFHVYSCICKWDNTHIGPLDEWTCQIVTLIILNMQQRQYLDEISLFIF